MLLDAGVHVESPMRRDLCVVSVSGSSVAPVDDDQGEAACDPLDAAVAAQQRRDARHDDRCVIVVAARLDDADARAGAHHLHLAARLVDQLLAVGGDRGPAGGR